MGSDTGIHTKRYQEPGVPAVETGLSKVEGRGETRAGAPLGAITVAEGRDAESWLQIAAETVGTRFRSDTKSAKFIDKMAGDDQEEVTEAVYGENWANATFSL